jgi:predicted peroxiredoxin
MLKDQLDELDLPGVRDFLDQIVASGGHLWACRLSADMNKVDMDDLYEGVEDIISASDFIEMTDGAHLLFI